MLLMVPCQSCTRRDTTAVDTHYFGIKINEVVCGYIRTNTYTYMEGEKEYGLIRTELLNKLSVLGGNADMIVKYEICYDPEKEGYFSFITDIELGKMKIHSEVKIEDNIAYHYESSTGIRKEVELGPDVIVEIPGWSPHLIRDFLNSDINEKTYSVFDDRTGDIIEKKYTRLDDEELFLAGKTYNVFVLEEFNQSIGMKSKVFIDKETELQVRFDPTENRSIFLADERIIDEIKAVDLNDVLFAKVHKVIQRVPELSYMKVRAQIKSAGEWLCAEDLSFPGQTFSGTVEENYIEGIFEIEPVRYYGENSPGFPFDYPLPDTLKKYIEPELFIESNDPILIKKAKEISEGSNDSWEAVNRFSKWVSQNIKPAIPGGTSAINTYKTRQGECGSHSRLLAAYCRAVGIPARMVIGCAYIKQYGGCFGQHAWTEVHMGDAGWIPVDATFGEIDYIDAGHIRLGEKSSFEPVEMEILEYRHAGETVISESEIPKKYIPYIGKYKVVETGKDFEILYKDEHLAVDIPTKMVLTLEDPDEKGRWYPQISRQIHFTFHIDESGNADELSLQQNVMLTKSNEQDEIPGDVPAELRAYLGDYKLLSIPGDFKVFYNDGALELDDPTNDLSIKLHPLDEMGAFGVDMNEDEVHFQTNADGIVNEMVIYSNLNMPRTQAIGQLQHSK